MLGLEWDEFCGDTLGGEEEEEDYVTYGELKEALRELRIKFEDIYCLVCGQERDNRISRAHIGEIVHIFPTLRWRREGWERPGRIGNP